MIVVKFTSHLQRFFPDLKSGTSLEAATVADLIRMLDTEHPGFAHYITDEQGRLRKHVNIFVEGDLITDRETLQDSLQNVKQVYLMQALSGG